MATNMQLFKQVDQLSNELRDARLEAERANERARRTKEHGDNLRIKVREAMMRIDCLEASLSAVERQGLLETFDALLTANDSIQEESYSTKSVEAPCTHATDIRASNEVPVCEEQVNATHASATNAHGAPDLACGSDQAVLEESYSNKSVEAPCTHATDTRASNEVPVCEEQVNATHASATNAHGAQDLACGSDQAVLEDVPLMDSFCSTTLREADWKPNAPTCFLCGSSFTLFRRRHHCRQCGNCVCADCSPFRVRLEAVAQRPSKNSFAGSAALADSKSHSNFYSMSRPMAHRVCTECHSVGIGTFASQRRN